MRTWLPALLLLGGCAAAHLTMYSADDSNTATVVVTGVIGDYGSARRDTGHHRLDLLLTKGTMRLDTAGFDATVKSRFGSPDINPATCSGTASLS